MKAFKWLNRHGASSVSLVLLLGVTAFVDFMARIRMEMANRQFAIMDARTVGGMRLIDFIHSQIGWVIGYVIFFLVCLLWLEFRTAPRWTVPITFILLALPELAYGIACFHIGSKFFL